MGTRAFSLVEQKKQQWAKEREEMVGLCGIWGSLSHRRFDERRPSIRTHYMSSIDLRRLEVSPEHSDSSLDASDKFIRRRSPSLPPIYKPTYQEENSCDGEVEEGETSGYASDSGERQDYQPPPWGHNPPSRQPSAWHSSNCVNTPDSLNSEIGRPRWGDKGVGVGHLWDASLLNPEARLPAVTDRPDPTPPAWLCRATNNTVSEVLVINHPETGTPLTEYSNSDATSNSDRTYLRGQNISIEPEELLERERKRQKAKELQNAIRQQLEEREKKRKEERERRQREERQEEERLKRQQEMERKRLEDEQLRQREKEVKEERKERAMKEAIEKAERMAKEEKIKTRKKHKLEMVDPQLIQGEENNNVPCITGSELKIARVEIEQPIIPGILEPESILETNKTEADLKEITKEIEINPVKTPESQKPVVEEKDTISEKPNQMTPEEPKKEETPESSDQDIEPDSLDEEMNAEVALVLTEPREVEVNQLSLVISPGRVLTPSKFRTNASYEKATQTDITKCRSQQRLEERPKWGVNRPETQYIKQSERDPYYQTRLRRNLLRVRSKPSKHEREDSRSPSPINMKIQGSQAPATTISRGTVTPRVMQIVLPSLNTVRGSKPQYVSLKGGVGAIIASNMFKPKPEVPPNQPKVDMTLAKDVLYKLTSLRQGLTLKQQEWDASRSQTPFSDVSSLS